MLCMRLLIGKLDLQLQRGGNASRSLERTQGGGYGKLGACSRRSKNTPLQRKPHPPPSKGKPASRQRSTQAHRLPIPPVGVRPPRHIAPLPFASCHRSRIQDISYKDLLGARGSPVRICAVFDR